MKKQGDVQKLQSPKSRYVAVSSRTGDSEEANKKRACFKDGVRL